MLTRKVAFRCSLLNLLFFTHTYQGHKWHLFVEWPFYFSTSIMCKSAVVYVYLFKIACFVQCGLYRGIIIMWLIWNSNETTEQERSVQVVSLIPTWASQLGKYITRFQCLPCESSLHFCMSYGSSATGTGCDLATVGINSAMMECMCFVLKFFLIFILPSILCFENIIRLQFSSFS